MKLSGLNFKALISSLPNGSKEKQFMSTSATRASMFRLADSISLTRSAVRLKDKCSIPTPFHELLTSPATDSLALTGYCFSSSQTNYNIQLSNSRKVYNKIGQIGHRWSFGRRMFIAESIGTISTDNKLARSNIRNNITANKNE